MPCLRRRGHIDFQCFILCKYFATAADKKQGSLLSEDQNIMESISTIYPEMEKFLVVDELFQYLIKYKVLTRIERENLGPQSTKTPTDKIRYLLEKLESKSPAGQTDFLKALMESSSTVSGHAQLIELLQDQGGLCLNQQSIVQLEKKGK